MGATTATLAALGQPIGASSGPAFRALHADTVEPLRQAFGTAVRPLAAGG